MNANVEPNVFCDGKWLVVPLRGAVFPNRCIKSNEPVEAADYVFHADLFRHQIQQPRTGAETATRLLFGSTVAAIANKQRLRFHIGLSQERQATARMWWRLGLGLVIVGPILGVFLAAGSAYLTESMFGTPSPAIAIAGGSLGMILMIVGLVLFGMSMMTLRVKRSDGMFLWLAGASPQFLASLPQTRVKWTSRGLFG